MAGKKRRTNGKATKISDPDETQSLTKTRADPLAVHELLYNVLLFATRATLCSCARVCQRWSEVALDRLWKHLGSVFPLLELVMNLGLLRNWELRVFNASQVLSNELSKANWSRFQSYSKRIRSLSYDSTRIYRTYRRTPTIAPEAIAMLRLHLPSHLDVLPHLETLRWSTIGSATAMLPFLSPRVKSLEVALTGDSQSVNHFFQALAGHVPNLKSFTLKTPTRAMDIEEPLRRLIGTWKKLETLVVPSYYLRPSILETVASLPNLKTLEQDYTHHPPYDAAAMLQKLPLPKNAFPELRTFMFNSNPASAQLFAQEYSDLFFRLTSIHINSPNGVNNEEVSDFVSHLGSQCTHLTSISLNLAPGLGPHPQQASPLPFEVLESLFPCRRLMTLEIGHSHPLTMNETNVERMAQAWPKLESFWVCPEPDLSLPTSRDLGTSLSILPTFARHFPTIKDLGFFFANDQNFSFSGDLYPEFEFQKLKILCVGVSSMPGGRSRDVGFLIASLCRVEPVVDIGVSVWYRGVACPEWEGYARQWDEAHDFLKFAMRTKIASRAKTSRTSA